MENTALSVGLVGIGNMGSAHATMVGSGQIKGLRLAAVCDIDPVRLNLCVEKNPGVRGTSDWRELVHDPKLDVIIVAVPHPLHADIAMEALKSGKHVLTEKVQTEQESAHPGILQNFTNAILYGEELLAPGTDGIYELSISNAAYLSSARGNVPVSLPLDGAEFDALLEKLIENSNIKENDPDSKYNTTYHQRWQVRW